MNIEDREVIYCQAIAHYGAERQIIKAIEEIGELLEEIARYKGGAANQWELMDEIADVSIMLEQMRLITDIDSVELEDRITYKVGRLAGRMEHEAD